MCTLMVLLVLQTVLHGEKLLVPTSNHTSKMPSLVTNAINIEVNAVGDMSFSKTESC